MKKHTVLVVQRHDSEYGLIKNVSIKPFNEYVIDDASYLASKRYYSVENNDEYDEESSIVQYRSRNEANIVYCKLNGYYVLVDEYDEDMDIFLSDMNNLNMFHNDLKCKYEFVKNKINLIRKLKR